MADDCVFMMGVYPAPLPGDRLYAETHFWFLPHEGRYRVGFTSYAVRLLQDVYFLDWTIDEGTTVARKQPIGEVESSKALSTIYAPVSGTIVAFNPVVASDPSAINADNYGEGWLYEMTTDQPLNSAADYMKILEAGWEKTQRMLKGQMNA